MMDNRELEALDQDVQILASQRRIGKLEEALDTFCETGFGKRVKHRITTSLMKGYNANTDGGNNVNIDVAGFNFLQIRALSLHETAHLLYSKAIEVSTPSTNAKGHYDYDPTKLQQRMAIQNGLEDGRVENKMSYRWPITANFLRWMAASDL